MLTNNVQWKKYIHSLCQYFWYEASHSYNKNVIWNFFEVHLRVFFMFGDVLEQKNALAHDCLESMRPQGDSAEGRPRGPDIRTMFCLCAGLKNQKAKDPLPVFFWYEYGHHKCISLKNIMHECLTHHIISMKS